MEETKSETETKPDSVTGALRTISTKIARKLNIKHTVAMANACSANACSANACAANACAANACAANACAASAADNQINRGTGAGGSNTNKTGLSYERLTDLSDRYTVLSTAKLTAKSTAIQWQEIQFNDDTTVFTAANQAQFFNYMKPHEAENITPAHGCKRPDEAYINENTKTVIIIEKKFQQVSGSVCEKIQTAEFKKWQYSRTFPDYKINYVYCLSEWFKLNCTSELEYLELIKIPVFWGNSPTYKADMVNFILSCK
jgi:hypothetical protein